MNINSNKQLYLQSKTTKTMKKLIIIALLAVCFVSCQKETIEAPKMNRDSIQKYIDEGEHTFVQPRVFFNPTSK